MNESTTITMVIAFSGVTFFVPLLAVSESADYQEVYKCEFRGRNFDNNVLAPLSPGTTRLMRPRDSGLAMKLPSGRRLPSVSISPAFEVKGDFEITVSFELPKPVFPESGYGCGPTVYIATRSADERSAMIGRLLRTGNKDVFSTNVASTVETKREQKVRLFPAAQKSGRLRLVREGTMLRFLAADGENDSFLQLRESEFNGDNISLVRVGAQQSDAATPVEVIWHELTIRAEQLPGRPETLAEGAKRFNTAYRPAPRPERWSLWWSFAAGVACIILVVSIVWYKKRNR